ncbi:MAG: hypothetical protein HFG15_00010 [Bacilli bacterium]|jgi:hypothetical protein|nr:hypothetical protein [Bacilli bacterium]
MNFQKFSEIENMGELDAYKVCKYLANNIVKHADTLTPKESRFVERVNQAKPLFKSCMVLLIFGLLVKILTLVVGFTTVLKITAAGNFAPYVADVFLTVYLMFVKRKIVKLLNSKLNYLEIDISKMENVYDEYVQEQMELQQSKEKQNLDQIILDQSTKSDDDTITTEEVEVHKMNNDTTNLVSGVYGCYEEEDRYDIEDDNNINSKGKCFVRKIGK